MHHIPFAVTAVLGTLIAAAAQPPSTKLEQPVGWKWLLEPVAASELGDDGKIEGKAGEVAYAIQIGEDGVGVSLTIPGGWQMPGTGTEYRSVAYDTDGERHEITTGGSSGDSKQMVVNVRLPAADLAPENIARVGVEMLTPEGRRELAKDALRRARVQGVEVLPLPEVGERLEFRLTTVDGETVSSRDLHGKVVLIDAWATWCSPCMQKMPTLRKFYEQHHDDGLEIVGINFDRDAEKLKTAIEEHGLAWPQVHVARDQQTRRLWYEASSFRVLPRLIVIDRAGVVRADCRPGAVIEELQKLLGTAASQHTP
jgi:thiol-disulfide isomerase/thioredoxin